MGAWDSHRATRHFSTLGLDVPHHVSSLLSFGILSYPPKGLQGLEGFSILYKPPGTKNVHQTSVADVALAPQTSLLLFRPKHCRPPEIKISFTSGLPEFPVSTRPTDPSSDWSSTRRWRPTRPPRAESSGVWLPEQCQHQKGNMWNLEN